jgi:hypothetical protein
MQLGNASAKQQQHRSDTAPFFIRSFAGLDLARLQAIAENHTMARPA